MWVARRFNVKRMGVSACVPKGEEMKRLSLLAIFACAAISTSAQAACPGAQAKTIAKDVSVARLPGKVFFRTKGLELDFDGSPHAYGLRDQGEEGICNGLAPLAPPCHGKYRGACFGMCESTFAAWSRNSGDPSTLPKTMCSVGLGGGGCSKPDVRLQAAPNLEWFVSETSLKTSPPSGPVTTEWLATQSAQLDPSAIRYLVVPNALMKQPWDVKLGDVGIAYHVADRKPVAFIVGDGGGLGEGSVSLLTALRPDQPPKLKPVVSALGEQVMRYTSGVAGEFRFVIFAGTATTVPRFPPVTMEVADHLSDWIDSTAATALRTSGSLDEISACSAMVRTITK
jgi:hypothetical protein